MWKYLPWPWIRRVNIVKMAIKIPTKITKQFFTNIERTILTFIEKKTMITKTIFNNKETAKGLTISNFKLYYIAIVIKSASYWHRAKPVDQWNKTEHPEINPNIFGHLIFVREAWSTHWKIKDGIFNKWCWCNWMAAQRIIQRDPYL